MALCVGVVPSALQSIPSVSAGTRTHVPQSGASKSSFAFSPLHLRTGLSCRQGGILFSQRKGLRCQAGNEKSGNSSPGDSTEDAFQRELRRRGLRPDGTKDPNFKGTQTATEEGKPDAPPRFAKTPDQLEKSRKLNSEGVEGLLPRAGELLKLGTTFFLAFWPLVLTTIVLFGGAYAVLGPNFVHGGVKSETVGAPKYVDPYELLAQDEIMRAYREGYIDR